MKRILPLFLVALLLASTMCMTAFASEIYVIESYGYGFFLDTVPDSGFYDLRLYVDDEFLLGYTSSPVYLNFDDYCVSEIVPGGLIVFGEEVGDYVVSDFPFYVEYGLDSGRGRYLQLYHYAYGDRTYFNDGVLVMELIPASSSSSISDIVTYDMVSGGLDQILDLLPIVLVVIVSFIGIRKGVSFLLQFIHGA